MDYEQLKKLMSEQKDEMTAAERLKAYNAGEEVGLGLTASMWDWGLRRLEGRLALC